MVQRFRAFLYYIHYIYVHVEEETRVCTRNSMCENMRKVWTLTFVSKHSLDGLQCWFVSDRPSTCTCNRYQLDSLSHASFKVVQCMCKRNKVISSYMYIASSPGSPILSTYNVYIREKRGSLVHKIM